MPTDLTPEQLRLAAIALSAGDSDEAVPLRPDVPNTALDEETKLRLLIAFALDPDGADDDEIHFGQEQR